MLWSPYTFQFNLSRHPAVSVPCGLSRDGLPVGLQIVSGHYKDALVLRAAARYAEADPLEFPVLPETVK
jgi:aspartyl-tRNA(Asn)/glutamyl-tRNA(Gln) amidotransferase subunit A